MKSAFWDTSALVPICVKQQPAALVRGLIERYDVVVWWATSVEMRSAFERLLRTGEMTTPQHAVAEQRLEVLRLGWREMQPTQALRTQAERLLTLFTLKAADALQLAAACIWASDVPKDRVFISGDVQLLQAARQLGFETIAI